MDSFRGTPRTPNWPHPRTVGRLDVSALLPETPLSEINYSPLPRFRKLITEKIVGGTVSLVLASRVHQTCSHSTLELLLRDMNVCIRAWLLQPLSLLFHSKCLSLLCRCPIITTLSCVILRRDKSGSVCKCFSALLHGFCNEFPCLRLFHLHLRCPSGLLHCYPVQLEPPIHSCAKSVTSILFFTAVNRAHESTSIQFSKRTNAICERASSCN